SPSGKNKDLVHVATAPNEAIAGMWKDILEDNGIQVLIKRKPLNYLNYGVPATDDLCEIYSPASQAQEVKQILESLDKAGDTEKPPDETDK
ncbi:MAG: hypothetical protein Q7R50_05445, partial [Dehalococcoidales bacterium]|nr:hypothetical protein [Dehalococcoidales bacterium]